MRTVSSGGCRFNCRLGWVGLRGGVLLGHSLVREQYVLLQRLVSSLTGWLGPPYAGECRERWGRGASGCRAADAQGFKMHTPLPLVHGTAVVLERGLALGFSDTGNNALQDVCRLVWRIARWSISLVSCYGLLSNQI